MLKLQSRGVAFDLVVHLAFDGGDLLFGSTLLSGYVEISETLLVWVLR
jgi:hypothetical protein